MISRIIAIVLFLSLALCVQVAIAQHTAVLREKAPHGILKYKIIDAKTDKTLSEQTLYIDKVYAANRFIPTISDKYFEDRYIKIYDDFIIGLNNYGYKNKYEVVGFGIWLNRLNDDVFSWEWYRQINDTTFKKIQGKGQLEVEFQKREDYWEISKMTFIGDHILRAKKSNIIADIIRLVTKGPKKDWYCVVMDGSYIIW